MKIEILENNNIIVKKGDTYYLIVKTRISGTFIENYFIYTNYSNNVDFLRNVDAEDIEQVLCFEIEKTTLEDALLFIDKEC